ncbi:taste receptor type 1 member 3 [Oryzias melastigma]|uniref:Taste receptor type 1 member 3 n=1 Tax=Oryzias melastigma TaxID=30732 RepID=A0A3B3CPB7_ORYME|nr:taste receptor type 1 member 3 [Oryzias melastigma]
MAACLLLLVVCWLFRPVCTSPEWFNNISTDLFSMPGDIKLGGLFPIKEQSNGTSNDSTKLNSITCDSLNKVGLGRALVMKYAVEEINGNNKLLPGVKLGYKIYNTCRHSAVVVRPALSFLTEKSIGTLSVECNYTDYETDMVAVIGPQTSEMVTVIGKLLGFFLMPQISFGATSDKFSDSLVYPSFFRTVPSDIRQVDAMAQLIKKFNWNWVAVVGSEEEYGQQGVQQFSKKAENMSVCVAYQGLIPIYDDPKPAIETIISNIKTTEVKVVVVFALVGPAVSFFEEVIKNNLSGVWIASSSWAIDDRIYSLPGIRNIGTVIGFIDATETLEQLSPFTEALFQKLSEKRTPSPSTEKPGDPENPCPECWDLSPANISLVKDESVRRTAFSVYAAVYTVAHALHQLLECNSISCKWSSSTPLYPWKLLEVLKEISVNISNTSLKFDENGNPNIGYTVIQRILDDKNSSETFVGSYQSEILNINKTLFKWYTNDSMIPESKCSKDCEPGQVRRVKGFHSCCFDCIDCLEGTYQANADDLQCTECPNRQWSSKSSNSCTDPIFEVLEWNASVSLYMILAGVVLLICQGSVFVLFLVHRGTPVVLASGGALTFVTLLGLMGACLSLLLFFGQPGDVVCQLQLPLISIFQTVALSVVLAVSLQLFLVTEFPETVAPHLQKLRGPASCVFVLICCVVQAGLCGWFVQEGPTLSQYKANMTINFLKSFLSCPVPSEKLALMQGLNGFMALVSFMCTFMAVKPLHQYNLARDITFSTLIYCVIWVIFIPVYTGFTTSQSTDSMKKSIAHVSFTLAGISGLVMAYYLPKCYLLLRKPNLNAPKQFCTFLEGVPPTRTEEEPQPQQDK